MIKKSCVLFCVIFLILAGTRYIYAQETPPSEPDTAGTEQPDSEGDGGGEDDGSEDDRRKKTPSRWKLYKKNGFFMALGGGTMLLVENGNFWGTNNTGASSAPNPIVFPFDFSVGFLIGGNNFFDIYVLPSLNIYWTDYRWGKAEDNEPVRPLPAPNEGRDEFVMGFLTGVDAEFQILIGKSLLLFGDAGIAVDMRLVMFADGINDSDKEEIAADGDIDKVLNYFWKRPFYFHAALGVGMRPIQNYSFAVNLNMWLPFAPPERFAGDSPMLGARFGLGVRISKDFKKDTTKMNTTNKDTTAQE
jgi:hypothetical protein